uniref:EF-hand domain-containing protein n=1 Tax=Oryza meridionalis TaxID=40149 RepID=A0A0E0F2A1_9ORYZ
MMRKGSGCAEATNPKKKRRDLLEQALKEQGLYDANEIKDVITDEDSNNDGRIDYSEFVAMMRKGSSCAEPSNPKKKRRDLVL